jgi:hypothetical protein
MGKIISSKRNGEDKIVFQVELEHEEATALKGHIDNIHLITENIAEYETNISTRGKNEATKYFLIPKNLRKNLDLYNPVSCQKINTDEKVIFIYIVDKNRTKRKIINIDELNSLN